MLLKQLTLSFLLLSAVAHNNSIAMQPEIPKAVLVSRKDLASQPGEDRFIVFENVRHYVYPHPEYPIFASNPMLYSQEFMRSLNKNVDWRRKNGYSKQQITYYHQEQLNNLAMLTKYIPSPSNQ